MIGASGPFLGHFWAASGLRDRFAYGVHIRAILRTTNGSPSGPVRWEDGKMGIGDLPIQVVHIEHRVRSNPCE